MIETIDAPVAAPAAVPPPLKTLAERWLREHRQAIEVRVSRHAGSVPRETGTRMLVSDGEVAGTIGGGHLELKAIAEARTMLASGDLAERERHYPLGPALGQCCGGAVTLAFAPLDGSALARWPDEPALFSLQLYGAGHVGRAIVKLLEGLPCNVQWIDERDSEFPEAANAPHIARVCVEPVELPRSDRLEDEACAVPASLRAARHRHRHARPHDVSDRRAGHRRQGAGDDRDRGRGAVAAARHRGQRNFALTAPTGCAAGLPSDFLVAAAAASSTSFSASARENRISMLFTNQ
jgi:xanthine/CO dehydrogenase XdhC/CoxF family maturation factor